ncbi:MAG TPA: glycine zipper 2TM domain-containing protein [Ramlibacter sp.]|nr:glycine zipper 2TM domain-containing protein [Ramlibacter sp.]
MNRIAIVSALLAATAAGAHAETFFDNARVRSAEPQYENVSVPRNECTTQTVYENQRVDNGTNYGGAVVGGVAGAVVGNQVGKGHGREAATALGAVVGAFAGDRIANGQRGEQYVQVPRQVQSCQTVNEVQQRLTGYRVHYDYRGQSYTTVMHDQPGPSLQVRVSVEPVVR